MGRNHQEPIETKSYLSLRPDGTDVDKVSVNNLGPEQKNNLGALLQVNLLNAVYAGRFEFQIASPSPTGEALPEAR